MRKRLIVLATILMFCGVMQAQNHWDFNYHGFQYQTYVTGRAYYGGVPLNSPNIEIAAFTGDEVCGDARLLELLPSFFPGEYYVYMTVFSNTVGQTVTFKAYDHDTNIEYDIYECETTVVTGDGNAFGSLDTGVLPMYFSYAPPMVYGPSYPWTPTTAFADNMSVTAKIYIDGVDVGASKWEVGAFCGDVCRGDTKGMYTVPGHPEMGYFTDVIICGTTGDIINFYLYDQDSNTIFEGICDATVTWELDGEIGDIANPFILNFQRVRTYSKLINAYSGDGGYYLIASPIGTVSPTKVSQMLSNSYDLYYFDQSQPKEWINYEGSDGNYNMFSGKGYLYANSADVILVFQGVPYSGNGQVSLTYDGDANLKGWNLVGNPFAQTAYITRGFYTMNADGSELIAGTGNSVGAMEGIFVVSENASDVSMTFSTTAPDKANHQLVISVKGNSRGSSNVVDRAVVRFGNDGALPKLQLFEGSTRLCIPQNDKEYAIACAEAQGEMPINFKAAQNGEYTITVNTEDVEMDYLHLIDNKTGNNVDLLVTPNYSFDAYTTDYASRFKLVFSAEEDVCEPFAFFSNGQIVINGEGMIQVIDLLGRIVLCRDAMHCVSTTGMAPGVYLLRLIDGENVKTQKIVVE